METFSREELLAAIQVYIIYLVMRIVDDALRHSEHDLHMLLSFQVNKSVICDLRPESLLKICSCFASNFANYAPSPLPLTSRQTPITTGKIGSSPNPDEGDSLSLSKSYKN